MDTQTRKVVMEIEREELQQLVNEVKETVATDISNHTPLKAQVFCAADLWNLQRKMKPAYRQKLTNRWGM
ncbi:MAG: hypothetical protein KGO81_13195 [Bacteroidota bacterium]|nr:hypothetical protein [Bacteroidota bacterium]